MKLGTKIIIVGFILFTVGVIEIELTIQDLQSEPDNMSDIPLWIRLVDDVPTFFVYIGIITTIAGFIIRRKQNTDSMRDMRK